MSDNYSSYYTFRMPRASRQRKQFSLPNYDAPDQNGDFQSENFAAANGTVRQIHHRTSAPPLSSKSPPSPNYSSTGNNSSLPYGTSRQPQFANGDRSTYGFDRQIENGYRTLPSRFHDAMRFNKGANPEPINNPNRFAGAAGRSPTESEYSVVNNFDYYRRQQLKQSALPSMPVNHRYSVAQSSEPVPPQPPADYDDDTPSPQQFSRSKSTRDRDRDRRGKSSSSSVSSAAPPPPPPPPPMPGQTVRGKRSGASTSSSSSRHSAPPPPPPPPPPTGSGSGGTVSGRKSHSQESKAANTSTNTIKSRKSLVPPGAMGGGDDRSEMMKQIQQGVKLKKVSKQKNQRLI